MPEANTATPMQANAEKRSVYLLVLPGVHLLDLAAAGQVFGHDLLHAQVDLHYISTEKQVTSHQGLALTQLEVLPTPIPAGSWLLLIGTSQAAQHLQDPYYRTARYWLTEQAGQFALIAGICSGALLAAAAGLLAGRRCTTHHALLDALRQLAPTARVQEDCIFVHDGRLWTSAGITTGIDLCLQLVAEYYGHNVAMQIARDMVVFQRRSGQEPQLSFWLQHRNHVYSRIHTVQDKVMSQPGYPWRAGELAALVYLGERQLRRLFQAATGQSMQAWIQQARLEYSRQLLQQTQLPLAVVAQRCGFASERSLRRLWQQQQGCSPSSIRTTQP